MHRIKGFDGLRGLAAVAVIFTHTVAGSTQIGGHAVNIFFALSGFLILDIIYRLRRKMETSGTSFGASLADFWTKRAARILPAYYVIAAVIVVYAWQRGLLSPYQVLAFATYTQNIGMAIDLTWWPFGYSWTLGVEQQFYFLAAPIFLLIPARHHRMILLATCASLFVATFLILALRILDPFAVYLLPFGGFMLAAGGGFWAISFAEGHKLKLPAYGALAIIVITCVLAAAPSEIFSSRPLLNLAQILFMIVALPALVAYIAQRQASAITRFLEYPLPRFYGSISYSLYLIHGQIAETLKAQWPTVVIGSRLPDFALTRLSLFIVVTLISTLLAWLSWKYIESTFRIRSKAPLTAKPTA